MTWDLIQRIAIPLLAAIAVVVAPIIGRRAAHKTADAALRGAIADERESEAARWQHHTDSVQRYADGMAVRLKEVEERLDEYQLRTAAADVRAATAENLRAATELRASKAESMYATALVYLRRISLWVNEHMAGIELPAPPVELEDDLR